MHSSVKLSLAASMSLLLTGCVPLEPLEQQNTSIADSPRQICETIRANEIRAESLYKNKRFTAQATFKNASQGATRYGTYDEYYDAVKRGTSLPKNATYSVFLTIGDTSRPSSNPVGIMARTASQDEQTVANLSKEQKVQVSGTITGFYKDFAYDCIISVDYATFSPL